MDQGGAMKPDPIFTGLYVPLVTPFTDDLRLAPDALARLADEALSAGASGLVALGTTAESATLTAEEKQTVVRICAAACREHGAPLIVGLAPTTPPPPSSRCASWRPPATWPRRWFPRRPSCGPVRRGRWRISSRWPTTAAYR